LSTFQFLLKLSYRIVSFGKPFDAHCCHKGTAIKHPVPDRVNPSFVIFDIRALWRYYEIRAITCGVCVNISWFSADKSLYHKNYVK